MCTSRVVIYKFRWTRKKEEGEKREKKKKKIRVRDLTFWGIEKVLQGYRTRQTLKLHVRVTATDKQTPTGYYFN